MRRGRAKKQKANKPTAASPRHIDPACPTPSAEETDFSAAPLIEAAKIQIQQALDDLARLAEDDDAALEALAACSTTLVDLATESSKQIQRFWFQGHADSLTAQGLYGDELGPRERLQKAVARERLVELAKKRLIWPVLVTTRPIDAERASEWVRHELRLGTDALIHPPRKDVQLHIEVFRELAAEVVREASSLRSRAASSQLTSLRNVKTPSPSQKRDIRLAELGLQLAKLDATPSKAWKHILTRSKNMTLLLGKDWAADKPKLAGFRHLYREDGGSPIPTHQSKRSADAKPRQRKPDSHAKRLQRHAEFELQRELVERLRPLTV
jgi:hypothetical protein